MSKKSLLISAFLAGLGTGANEFAYAQTKNNSNLINSEEDLTIVDRSRFLVSLYKPIEISKNSEYNFEDKFSSKDSITYRFMDLRIQKDSAAIKNDIKKVKNPLLKKKYLNSYLEARNSSIKHLDYLNDATKDGIITENELKNIEEGTYFVEIKTPTQSVIRILKIKPSKLEEKVGQDSIKTEKRMSQPRYLTSNTDSSKIDSSKIDYSMHPNASDTSKYKIKELKSDTSKSGKETPVAKRKSVPTKKSGIKKSEDRLRFGVEASAGLESEVLVGAFVSSPVTEGVNLEAYADYFASQGYYIARESKTSTTTRETQLIGPATYKKRTDELTESSKKSPLANFGVGAEFELGAGLGIPLRMGVELAKEERTKNGKSTIEFERNSVPLQTPIVIENMLKEKSVTKGEFAVSAGLIYHISKNLSVDAMFNKGLVNSGRLNVRLGF